MSTTGAGTDAFPGPTSTAYDRGSDVTELYPYQDPSTGRAPQAEFLAGPPGEADIETTASNHAFVSGLGAGKTAAGVLRAFVNAERWNPGELGMIVAPTVPALKNAILPVMREFGILDVCEYRGKGSEEPGVITPSGSRIILESADNERKIERLRGPNLAWVWMDEAALIDERAWDILAGRLRVGSYRNAFVTTTPKGKNWVYSEFYDDPGVEHRYRGEYEWVTANDTNGVFGVPSFLNTHNPEDYADRLESQYSGAFYRQEVLGEFTKFEGLVYRWFGENHVIEALNPESADYDEVVYGVDWGHNNPAVVLAVVRQGDRWVVADEWYERRCTVNDHSAAAQDLVERWGPGTVFCDPAEPGNIEQFRRDGLTVRKANNDVTPGIQHVSSLQDDLVVARNCQAVRNEFAQYQYKDDDSDDVVKQNDHAMDALRYALYTQSRAGGDVRRAGSLTDLL